MDDFWNLGTIEASMEEARAWAKATDRSSGRPKADAALVRLVEYLADSVASESERDQVRRILDIYSSF